MKILAGRGWQEASKRDRFLARLKIDANLNLTQQTSHVRTLHNQTQIRGGGAKRSEVNQSEA